MSFIENDGLTKATTKLASLQKKPFYKNIAEKKSSSQTFPGHPEAAIPDPAGKVHRCSSQTFPRHPEAAIPDPAGKVHRCSSLRRKFIKEKMQLPNLPGASGGSNPGSSRKSAQMQLFKKEVYKGKKAALKPSRGISRQQSRIQQEKCTDAAL